MLQQPERVPAHWVAFTCRHCKAMSDHFIGDLLQINKIAISGYRRCWSRVVCPHCLASVMVSMGPPGIDYAVNELGAPLITLSMDDPDPVDKLWVRPDDAVQPDELLDFMSFLRDTPDEEILASLIGGESV